MRACRLRIHSSAAPASGSSRRRLRSTAIGPFAGPILRPAVAACVVTADHPAVRSAVAWLEAVQRPDGGFGEVIVSYADPSLRGRGPATPSQTACALLGYAAAGEAGSEPAKRAVDWLCFVQRSNGDWDEYHYTGTGFPLDFMIRYHLYRLHFPLMALGRLRERLAA